MSVRVPRHCHRRRCCCCRRRRRHCHFLLTRWDLAITTCTILKRHVYAISIQNSTSLIRGNIAKTRHRVIPPIFRKI